MSKHLILDEGTVIPCSNRSMNTQSHFPARLKKLSPQPEVLHNLGSDDSKLTCSPLSELGTFLSRPAIANPPYGAPFGNTEDEQ
jgi:hypothetical protein